MIAIESKADNKRLTIHWDLTEKQKCDVEVFHQKHKEKHSYKGKIIMIPKN
jgi:hypothetical protein